MNTLAKWNPLRDVDEMHNRLMNVLMPRFSGGQESLTQSEWAPSVDIHEDDNEYVITAELPEVKKEDVKIKLEHGVLTLTGERRFEKEEKNRKYHRVERSYGSFVRSFALPDDIDPAKVDARFKEGLLKIHVTKSEKARPKQIEIKID